MKNHTRIFISVLDNIDERVIAHIDSITVLSSVNDVSLICNDLPAGCALADWENEYLILSLINT